jgi:DNA-binding transcriptional MocR family regulator
MKSWQYQEAIFASNLSYKAKLVGLAISYYYNWKEATASFPSIQLLQQRTSLSRATIHRAKQELVASGYLTQQRRYDSSNLYLPVIPGMSQTESSLVSEGRTNNEYNYEVNNDNKIPSFQSGISLDINNINQGEIVLLENTEIWRKFENEERYTRPPAVGRSNRKPRGINKEIGRNNPSSTEVARFHQELANAREELW